MKKQSYDAWWWWMDEEKKTEAPASKMIDEDGDDDKNEEATTKKPLPAWSTAEVANKGEEMSDDEESDNDKEYIKKDALAKSKAKVLKKRWRKFPWWRQRWRCYLDGCIRSTRWGRFVWKDSDDDGRRCHNQGHRSKRYWWQWKRW